MSFQLFRQSTILYNCTTFNLFSFISVWIAKGNLSFRETTFRATKANKIFKNQSNFLHLLPNQTIIISKISKINAVEEKKLRNKSDAREEHWSVQYPCLPPLMSCEMCGEGHGLMRNSPPHSLCGAPRKEWKANSTSNISLGRQKIEFYRRDGQAWSRATPVEILVAFPLYKLRIANKKRQDKGGKEDFLSGQCRWSSKHRNIWRKKTEKQDPFTSSGEG